MIFLEVLSSSSVVEIKREVEAEATLLVEAPLMATVGTAWPSLADRLEADGTSLVADTSLVAVTTSLVGDGISLVAAVPEFLSETAAEDPSLTMTDEDPALERDEEALGRDDERVVEVPSAAGVD